MELIAIILILGILAVATLPRFTLLNTKLLEAQGIVLTSLRHARQLALTSATSDISIVLTISANQVDLQEDGGSLIFPEITYPIVLPTGVSISQGIGVLNFDTLGNSTATAITISDGSTSQTINLTGAGYAY